jgi:hypothetical protein
MPATAIYLSLGGLVAACGLVVGALGVVIGARRIAAHRRSATLAEQTTASRLVPSPWAALLLLLGLSS